MLTLSQVGFGVETALLIIACLGITGGSYEKISKLLGGVSFIWFFLLIQARYDHYGRVCSGDSLADKSTSPFQNFQFAAFVIKIYFAAILGCAGLLFVGIAMYSILAPPLPQAEKPGDKHSD